MYDVRMSECMSDVRMFILISPNISTFAILGTYAKKTAHSNYFVIPIHFFTVLLLDVVKYLKIVWVEH